MTDFSMLEHTYVAHNIMPLPITLVRGEGVYVYDEQGRRYIDMMSAVSVNNFGHQHPRLLAALMAQAQKIAVTSRLVHCETLGLFLQSVCELASYDCGLPVNSGVEAVETALKAARKWGYLHKGIADNEAEIIVCANNFHGRTITTISLSTQENYRKHFGPFTPGFKTIPYNDVNALRDAITPRTAAFLVEPIQGEAGVQIPDVGYLRACAKMCKENEVLLICDEIQTGMGRTGKFLASEYEQIKPDAVLLGKALGGGLLPVSLFLADRELMSVFRPGDHGSTFGGNPLASAVGHAAIQVLIEEQLIENAAQQGAYFAQQLRQLNSPLIKDVRGKGLLMAVDINLELIDTKTVWQHLCQNGLLTINTRDRCLRLFPALLITREQIDEAMEILAQTLKQLAVEAPC